MYFDISLRYEEQTFLPITAKGAPTTLSSARLILYDHYSDRISLFSLNKGLFMETEIPYTLLTRTKINSNLCQTSLTFVKEVDNGLEKIMTILYFKKESC